MNYIGTKRRQWNVAGLIVVTLGAYGVVWWYKINRELDDLTGASDGYSHQVNPRRSLLAVTIGLPFIVPPIVSIVHANQLIAEIESRVLVVGDSFFDSPYDKLSGTLLSIAMPPFGAAYIQANLNRIWDAVIASKQ